MAERPRGRWRLVVGWLMTIALVAYAASDWKAGRTPRAPAPTTEAVAPSRLRIVSISSAEVSPGDAIVVQYVGADPGIPLAVHVGGAPAEVLAHRDRAVVVRIPHDAGPGKAGLRLLQGDRRSKSRDLQVRIRNRQSVIRLTGGLALFVFGLGLLGQALRGLAGHRLRRLLGQVTRSPLPSVGLGVGVGAITQLTTSAAAFTVGLVEARLMTIAAAIPVMVGAVLGASITGALLPVALTQQSLLVIAVGVLWSRLAVSRRGAAFARLVLSAGLMLYGLRLLQTGIEPLVGDPTILPYVSYFRASGPIAELTCAATGALLALVLLGPASVYGLVVGLAQTTGVLPLSNALAMLAGANLGASVGMALIAWQAGHHARPLVRPQLAFGGFATAMALLTIPVWQGLAGLLPLGDPNTLTYGQTVILPHVSRHLAAAFAMSELAVVAMWMGALPVVTHLAGRRARVAPPPPAPPEVIVLSAERELAEVFDRQRAALEGAFEMSRTGERGPGPAVEAALADGRRAIERQYVAVGAAEATPRVERVKWTVVATLQLQRALEHLLNVTELGVERGLRLTPDELTHLREMHDLAQGSFAAAIESIDDGGAPDLEAAGEREIRMNVLEAEARVTSVAAPRRGESTSVRLGLAELIDAYEHVGNHLYRVCKAMRDDADDLD